MSHCSVHSPQTGKGACSDLHNQLRHNGECKGCLPGSQVAESYLPGVDWRAGNLHDALKSEDDALRSSGGSSA